MNNGDLTTAVLMMLMMDLEKTLPLDNLNNFSLLTICIIIFSFLSMLRKMIFLMMFRRALVTIMMLIMMMMVMMMMMVITVAGRQNLNNVRAHNLLVCHTLSGQFTYASSLW